MHIVFLEYFASVYNLLTFIFKTISIFQKVFQAHLKSVILSDVVTYTVYVVKMQNAAGNCLVDA